MIPALSRAMRSRYYGRKVWLAEPPREAEGVA